MALDLTGLPAINEEQVVQEGVPQELEVQDAGLQTPPESNNGLDLTQLPDVAPEQPVPQEPVDESKPVMDHLGEVIPQVGRAVLEAGDETMKSVHDFADSVHPAAGMMTRWADSTAQKNRNSLIGAIDKAETMTGEVVNDITQFLTGMFGATKAMKALGWQAKTKKSLMARETLAGGISEGVAMNPEDGGLSDLLNKYPMFEGFVPDMLTSHPDDTRAEARARKFFDGLAWGALGESLFLGFKAARAKYQGNNEEAVALSEEAEKVAATHGQEAPQEVTQVADEVEGVAAKEQPEVEIEPVTVVGDKTLNKLRLAIQSAKSEAEVSDAVEGIDFNFNNMTSEDSVKDVINAVSEVLAPQINKAKGGVRSLEETEKLADLLGTDSNKLIQQMSETHGATANLDAIATAGRIMMQKLSDNVADLAEMVSNGAEPAHKAEFIRQLKLLSEVTAMQKGMQTNIARALSSHRIKVGSKFNDIPTKDLQDIINSAGGDDKLLAFAENVKLNRGNPRAMRKAVEKGWAGKLIDVHNEYWINSILSGTTTHAVNLTSALIQTTVMPAQRMIGAGMSGDLRGVREGAAHYMSMVESSMDALKLATAAMKKGDNVLDTNIDTASRVEISSHAISSRNLNMRPDTMMGRLVDGIGSVARIPSRFLLSEDEFFKQLNYRSRMRSRSYMEAFDQGLKGKDVKEYVNKKMTEAFDSDGRGLDEDAMQWARESTFTQDLGVGTFGKNVQDFVGRHPAMRVVTPFIRTPTNLLRTAWQHAPAIQFFQKNLREDLKAGGHRAQLAKGKIATSNTIALIASNMAIGGMITGGTPKNKAERDPKFQTGWQPYSFVFENEDGTKRYVPFGRLDPYGMMFGILADTAEMSDKLADEDIYEIGMAVTTALAKNVTSKTYLSGLSKILEVGMSGDPDKAERWIRYQVGSYSPNIFNQINNDPYMREARTVAEGILARNGLTSKSLPPKRTVLGEPIKRSTHALPWQTSDEKDEKVYEELASLGGAVAHPPTKMNGVELTEYKNSKGQDAYDRFLELQSTLKYGKRTLKQSLLHEMDKSSYQRLPSDAGDYKTHRAKILQKIAGRYRKLAERQLRKEEFTFDGTQVGKSLDEALKIERINKKKVPIKGLDSLIQ